MNADWLPDAAFIDPQGRNYAQVARLAQRLLELVLNHTASAAERSPLPLLGPDQQLAAIPEQPLSEPALLERLQALLAGSMNPAHPGAIAHMDPPPTLISALGEFVSAAINNNMLSVEMSPALSWLEQQLLRTIAARFGLGTQAGGVMAAGGSLANLQALAVARNQRFAARESGIVGLARQPVILASAVAHTSIHKAAMLLGLGTAAVLPVAVNDNSQMQVADLERQIARARAAGQEPFCVVATVGTTTTGSVDPLPAIAQVARQQGLWLHVDAAYGGALIFSERQRHRLAGIELADSLIFNPQKWLYVAKTCAMVLFNDATVLEQDFRIGAPYMRTPQDLPNLGELSIQGTRHADVLKLWLSLQHLGQAGYAALIEHGFALAEQLVDQLQTRPYLALAGHPDLNIVCFQGRPGWLQPEQWDHWNEQLQSYLLSQTGIFVSLPLYRGSRWLRVVLLNPYTDAALLDSLVTAIDTFAQTSRHQQA